MPSKRSRCAVVLVDVISEFDFEDADQLLAHARPATRRIQRFVERARRTDTPVVYVNDNDNRWDESFDGRVARVLQGDSPGQPIAEALRPRAGDLSVLKPKHSAFHATALEYLLAHHAIEEIVFVGWQAHLCILVSAYDAHMLGYRVTAPRDCVASNTSDQIETALHVMESAVEADTRSSVDIDFADGR